MTRLPLLLLVACSSQSRPDAATANGPFTPTPEVPVRTAPHGTAIDQLAVSDDGTAAVTQDGMGGSRVWLALDGTREPVIITLAPADELANTIRWLGDDLVIDYLAGLGKIDAATGALIHRTCGWSFGLSALPNNEARELESICDAP